MNNDKMVNNDDGIMINHDSAVKSGCGENFRQSALNQNEIDN